MEYGHTIYTTDGGVRNGFPRGVPSVIWGPVASIALIAPP